MSAVTAAGNAGINPTDTLGTVVRISQATLGGAGLIAGNVYALVKSLGLAGFAASAVGLYDNYLSIKTDLVNGQPPTLSDISGAVGNAAVLVGSGLILADVSGTLIIPLAGCGNTGRFY